MNVLYRHRVLLGFVAIGLSVALTFGVCFFALSYTAQASFRQTVVIDAGHGGIDGGVTGVSTGAKESDINLSVARLLQREFEEAGLNVVQTRETEAGLYGAATSGYKRRDMQRRAEIIRAASPALVISVHQNAFPLSSRRGAQVFFREGEERSVSLACMIQSALNDMPDCARRSEPLKGDYFILTCSECVSVLVECGFLSNPQDEALLLTQSYRERIAKTIAAGALSFLASPAAGA